MRHHFDHLKISNGRISCALRVALACGSLYFCISCSSNSKQFLVMHWYLQFLALCWREILSFHLWAALEQELLELSQITQLCWPHTTAEPRRYVYACWSAHFSCLFWVLLWFVGGGGQNENLRKQPKYPSCLSSNRIRQEIKVRARHI